MSERKEVQRKLYILTTRKLTSFVFKNMLQISEINFIFKLQK